MWIKQQVYTTTVRQGLNKLKEQQLWKTTVETAERSSIINVDKEIFPRRNNPTLKPVAFLFV